MRDDDKNCEALYWKAKALKQQSNFEEAVRVYEWAISLNKSQTATLKSIYDICLIRILERDIYLAYHTLDRLEEVPEDLEDLFQLKLFLNGAVNMIKKKFREGLEVLEKVDLKKLKEKEIVRLTHSYRAYGLFCEGKILEAIEVYKFLESSGQIHDGDVYNLMLCEGIDHGEQNKFEQAVVYFEKAKSMYKIKVEPTFYLVVVAVHGVPGPDPLRRRQPRSIQQLHRRAKQPEVLRDSSADEEEGADSDHRPRRDVFRERLELEHALLHRSAQDAQQHGQRSGPVLRECDREV